MLQEESVTNSWVTQFHRIVRFLAPAGYGHTLLMKVQWCVSQITPCSYIIALLKLLTSLTFSLSLALSLSSLVDEGKFGLDSITDECWNVQVGSSCVALSRDIFSVQMVGLQGSSAPHAP